MASGSNRNDPGGTVYIEDFEDADEERAWIEREQVILAMQGKATPALEVPA